MNLHEIVSGAIAQINPFIDGFVGKNAGYSTNDDGTRIASFTYYAAELQVQAADEDTIKFINNQGIQGVLRSVYLNGNWTGIVRPDNFGGDIVQFNGKNWSVVQVKESWPDWTHLIVVLRDNSTLAQSLSIPPLNLEAPT